MPSRSVFRLPRPPRSLSRFGALAGACALAALATHASAAVTPAGRSRARAHEAHARTAKAPEAKRTEAPSPQARFRAWLSAHLPEGAHIADLGIDFSSAPQVVYTTKAGDTLASIARHLLELSETYLWDDFARELEKVNPKLRAGVQAGMHVVVPNLIRSSYATGDDARIGWPQDKELRGIYVRGDRGGSRGFPAMLDKMAERGINAIVLDTKDTDGLVTYPSKVPLAIETEATKNAPIADLARTIRFAHARGIRVIMRVSCFHDEWMQHHRASTTSIRGKLGGIYPIGWMDPASDVAQRYLIDLAKEAMDAGADEIELDYVRYPVIGIKNADFHLDRIGKTKPEVIRDFVHDVHAVTKARGVPLSLDIFGVVAQGRREDIEGLGQDITMLGPECEVLSPMVYPSHYAPGFLGFDVPGNHPELVGYGTKGTLEQLGARTHTLVRPWVQASAYESPDYGPQYLAQELRSARDNGSSGWLMWNPQQNYGMAFGVAGAMRR